MTRNDETTEGSAEPIIDQASQALGVVSEKLGSVYEGTVEMLSGASLSSAAESISSTASSAYENASAGIQASFDTICETLGLDSSYEAAADALDRATNAGYNAVFNGVSSLSALGSYLYWGQTE